jgi:type I restriction enzyme M protein
MEITKTANFREKANLIWNIAELLRGEYKQADYGKVVLPLVVLKRLDSVLAPTKEKVLEQFATVKSLNVENIDPILNREVFSLGLQKMDIL